MTKNVKIPKKIAGVKLHKKVRKTANRAIKMSSSPAMRELAAAAIGAAGTRAAGDRKDPDHGLHHIRGRAHFEIRRPNIGDQPPR